MKWKERGMVFMKLINKDYFKYLIKQHKRLLFLIWLIGFILIPFISLMNPEENFFAHSHGLSSLISISFVFVISFLAPIYLFSFLQKKKSTILYFSLPIKKQSLFITTTLFSLAATITPVVIYYSITYFLAKLLHFEFLGDAHFILTLFIMVFYMICLQVFVTTITLLCQNTLDSFIVNVAYMITPYIVFLCFYSYISGQADIIMLGQGNYADFFSDIIYYISLPYCAGFEVKNYLQNDILVSIIPHIYWTIVTIILYLTSYQLFMKRTMEQSENHTKSRFIYPLLITAIIFSLMFVMYGDGISETNIFIYSLIFILYLVMYFFAVRRVYFTWKIPVIFVTLLVCCIGFAQIFNNTQGFGLLSEYPNIENYDKFQFNAYTDSQNLIYNNKQVNQFYIDSQNENTLHLILKFHKDLINKKIISSYHDTSFSEDSNILYINIYYNQNYNNNYVNRYYVIDSKEKIDEFIKMYDEFLKNVESHSEYTCHHDEYLTEDTEE